MVTSLSIKQKVGNTKYILAFAKKQYILNAGYFLGSKFKNCLEIKAKKGKNIIISCEQGPLGRT
jgi:hypothetical protein